MAAETPTSPRQSVYTADIVPRILATIGGVVLSLIVLGTEHAPWWLRLVVWIAIGAGVAVVFVRAAGRRLEIHNDRVVIVSGGKQREILFREIDAWMIPAGALLVLHLDGDRKETLGGWARGGDLVAALLAAIRVAGCTFEAQPDGKIHHVVWND